MQSQILTLMLSSDQEGSKWLTFFLKEQIHHTGEGKESLDCFNALIQVGLVMSAC